MSVFKYSRNEDYLLDLQVVVHLIIYLFPII